MFTAVSISAASIIYVGIARPIKDKGSSSTFVNLLHIPVKVHTVHHVVMRTFPKNRVKILYLLRTTHIRTNEQPHEIVLLGFDLGAAEIDRDFVLLNQTHFSLGFQTQ